MEIAFRLHLNQNTKVHHAPRKTFIPQKMRKLRDKVVDGKPIRKWTVNKWDVTKKIEFICSGYGLEKGLYNKPLVYEDQKCH